jgi:hypothetical protein
VLVVAALNPKFACAAHTMGCCCSIHVGPSYTYSALRSVVGAMPDKAIHNRCSGCPSHPLLDRFWTTYGCAFPIMGPFLGRPLQILLRK